MSSTKFKIMLKFILIPLKLLMLFFITSYFTSGLSIVQEAPDRIDSLSSCTVSLKVNTGGVTGFAKLQHRFPEGIQIEPLELHGATFSFDNRQMKVIWMNLPETKEFSVSYKLTVTNPEIVEVPLGGIFSYLEENKRTTYDIEQKIMKVGPDAETVKEQTRPQLAVNRTFEQKGTDRYRVTLRVESKYVTGFAKIEEVVPFDAVAKGVENRESVYSQVDNRVKFVWMSLPDADTFSVVYDLDLSGAVSQNTDEIEGKFSYLYDNETQKVNIESGFRSEPKSDEEESLVAERPEPKQDAIKEEVTDEEPEQEEKPEQPVLTEKEKIDDQPEAAEKTVETVAVEEVKLEEDPREDIMAKSSEEEKQEETATASSEIKPDPGTEGNDEGIEYRVQILAGKNSVEAPYFRDKYSFENAFFVENHEGWIKYTTGGYSVYRQARDAREEMRKGYDFPGPFVVAYNDGLRITVQEALMVTNQKWIK